MARQCATVSASLRRTRGSEAEKGAALPVARRRTTRRWGSGWFRLIIWRGARIVLDNCARPVCLVSRQVAMKIRATPLMSTPPRGGCHRAPPSTSIVQRRLRPIPFGLGISWETNSIKRSLVICRALMVELSLKSSILCSESIRGWVKSSDD